MLQGQEVLDPKLGQEKPQEVSMPQGQEVLDPKLQEVLYPKLGQKEHGRCWLGAMLTAVGAWTRR